MGEQGRAGHPPFSCTLPTPDGFDASAALRYRVTQCAIQRPRPSGVRRPPVRWVGITLCLLWTANQLSRLITWLRQWGQRDPVSQAFQREVDRRGLVLR